MARDGSRREEILQAAAALFASHRSRVSLDDIGQEVRSSWGNLYHLRVEGSNHYRVGQAVSGRPWIASPSARMMRLATTRRPFLEQIVALGTAIAACAVERRALSCSPFTNLHRVRLQNFSVSPDVHNGHRCGDARASAHGTRQRVHRGPALISAVLPSVSAEAC